MQPPVWLVGSGASVDAGIPLVRGIDKYVFDEPFWRHTGGSYLHGENPNPANRTCEPDFQRVRCLLRWLRDLQTQDGSQPQNYEEVYYLLEQVRDADSGEFDNRAIAPMAEKVREYLTYLDSFIPPSGVPTSQLVDEACTFVPTAVRYALSPDSIDLTVVPALLDCIEDAQKADRSVIIGTLNHDRLLDKVFAANNVPYADGFESDNTGNRHTFNRKLIAEADEVVLLKLHGSIRWVVVQEPNGDQEFAEVLDWKAFQKEQVRTPGLDVIDGQPRILLGMHNKITLYSRPLFWHLFRRFRDELERASRLVVVGYGFRDKGINDIFIDWLAQDKARRALVVDPYIENTIDHSRPAIQRGWPQWTTAGRVVPVGKRFKEVSWLQIQNLL